MSFSVVVFFSVLLPGILLDNSFYVHLSQNEILFSFSVTVLPIIVYFRFL